MSGPDPLAHERLDAPLKLGLARATLAAPSDGLDRHREVVQELLLPAVEHRGLELVLVAQIRDGDLVLEVPAQDRRLLLRAIPSTVLLAHERLLPSLLDGAGWCRVSAEPVHSRAPHPSEGARPVDPRRYGVTPGAAR
jgi:hypothetical protein